jgi:phosphatidylserine/phosphatidylglycerophosphate/cardiolipin synthase-like enzyme
MRRFIAAVFLLLPILTHAAITVCFTPAQSCTGYVVQAIDQAKTTILVQAYSFTSKDILSALKVAHDRGVDVKVILDKGQYRQGSYRSSTYLTNNDIPTWIDYRVAIQHNKVMIIDGELVVTGSFNFTAAADRRNSENLLLIQDQDLAKKYTDNWMSREKVSRKLD